MTTYTRGHIDIINEDGKVETLYADQVMLSGDTTWLVNHLSPETKTMVPYPNSMVKRVTLTVTDNSQAVGGNDNGSGNSAVGVRPVVTPKV